MSDVDKSRPMPRKDQAPDTPGDAQSGPASSRAAASRLLASGDAPALMQWSAAIVVAVVALQLSRGTSFHQLAIGVLGALICSFVGLSLVEIVWRLVAAARFASSSRRRQTAGRSRE